MLQRYWDDLMDLDRPFLDFFRSGPFGVRPWVFRRDGSRFLPAIDVFERDGDLVARFELPGIDPEKDVSVTLEENRLVVKGERKQEEEVKEAGYYRREFAYGSFERQIPVPAGTREADIKAGYKNGVLEVVIPKAAKVSEKKPSKQIPVTASKS